MGVYKLDEIAAIIVEGGNIVCIDCATDEEMNALTAEGIIEKSVLENDDTIYFCERCKKRILA